MSKPRVAFFGLGLMGSGMARRLLVNGFPLTVFNRNPDKSAPLAAEGARAAASPREAAADADVLISMLADDHAARAVWLGENGALAAAPSGAICVECSTVTVDWVRELAAAAQSRQCGFIDAPVTGTRPHAAAGELNFLVGGDPVTLEKVRSVLAVMSKSITHLGPVGSGALIKLINNFMCGVQVVALAEALAMIERSGLDRRRTLEVINGGAPGSPLSKLMTPRMTTPDYTPNFPLRLMAKDLGYPMAEAEKFGVKLGTAPAALALFQEAIAAGRANQDMAAVAEQFRTVSTK